jgi:hypothetical protein
VTIIPAIILLACSYVFGLLFPKTIWGKSEGEQGVVPNLRLKIKGNIVRPHHWMLFLVLAFGITVYQAMNGQFSDLVFFGLLGFFVGGMHHGLMYKDWHVIISNE